MKDTHNPRTPSTHSRRTFLRVLVGGSGVAVGSTLLAACGSPNPAADATDATSVPVAASTTAPAVNSSTVTLTIMSRGNEFSAEETKAFTDANPGIVIERLEDDATRFKAMLAAGTPPDIFRTQGPSVPNLINQGVLLDLTPYFNASSMLKTDDLAPSINFYRVDGKLYGMPKDWSPDLSMFASKSAFEDAGVALPDPAKPLLYSELATIGKQLTKREGDRTLRFGYAYDSGLLPRMLQTILLEKDQQMYAPDFSTITLKDNPLAREALQFFFDLSKEQATFTPLNPSASWIGEDFVKGQVGIVQYGYWFSGMISTTESPITGPDQTVMLTSPSWFGTKQVNPTVTATGFVIAQGSKNPEAAWKLFEFYNAGAPAENRAKSGWGVPGLKSLYSLMPAESPFQQQVQTILKQEITNSDYTLSVNPYYDDSVFGTSWTTNLEQALRGDLSFDQVIENIETDVNAAIADGKATSA